MTVQKYFIYDCNNVKVGNQSGYKTFKSATKAVEFGKVSDLLTKSFYTKYPILTTDWEDTSKPRLINSIKLA